MQPCMLPNARVERPPRTAATRDRKQAKRAWGRPTTCRVSQTHALGNHGDRGQHFELERFVDGEGSPEQLRGESLDAALVPTQVAEGEAKTRPRRARFPRRKGRWRRGGEVTRFLEAARYQSCGRCCESPWSLGIPVLEPLQELARPTALRLKVWMAELVTPTIWLPTACQSRTIPGFNGRFTPCGLSTARSPCLINLLNNTRKQGSAFAAVRSSAGLKRDPVITPGTSLPLEGSCPLTCPARIAMHR